MAESTKEVVPLQNIVEIVAALGVLEDRLKRAADTNPIWDHGTKLCMVNPAGLLGTAKNLGEIAALLQNLIPDTPIRVPEVPETGPGTEPQP